MKLIELEPHWVGLSPGHAIGVTFLCPHCRAVRLGVGFDVPIGGATLDDFIGARLVFSHANFPLGWHREGETFETLTLTPSVDTSQHGHWHGFIANGEIK
jgi:hypothetical protein